MNIFNFNNDKPIFLHFLNREICETEHIIFDDKELYEMVLVSLLSTTSFIYVGHSLVVESIFRYPKTVSLLMFMEKYGHVYLIGNEVNIGNYLNKRQELYRYNKKKYNMYFKTSIEKIPWPSNPVITDLNTTSILYKLLIEIVNDLEVDSEYMIHKLSSHDKNRIGNRLIYQKKQGIAITKTLFQRTIISSIGKEVVNKLIIQIYNRRYCDEFKGTYITGIPGLTYYDQFEKTGLLYNYKILDIIFKELKIISKNEYDEKERLLCLFEYKHYGILLKEIRKYISGISQMSDSIAQMCIFIKDNLKDKFNKYDKCDDILFKLFSISNQLKKDNSAFREGYDCMLDDNIKIIVVSASALEYRILRECAKDNGFAFIDVDTNYDDYSFAECLEHNQKKVYLARTDMGALNASHSIELLSRTIKPDFVIVGGICVGLNKKKQKITQLLISRQIHDYDLKKITNGNRIMRGTTIPANRYLYDKAILESFDLPNEDYDEGLIISANVLVNDEMIINQMIEDKPDAIGYEMEGGGISYICNIFKNRWIMIKAISDWGINKDNSHQYEAALKSYNFIFRVIKRINNY